MTPALIRAARGLLDWQQSDLAKAAALSLSAVNKFERGLGKPHPFTLQAIQTALEDAGIEFLANGGLRHADEVTGVQKIFGDHFIAAMNDDIYASVRKAGQEIYTCSVDEAHWFAPELRKTTAEYFRWRDKMGIKELYLVTEGSKIFEGPRHNYRCLPPNLIGTTTYVIYADRMAIILWRKKQVFILRGKQLIEPFREQFKFLWRQAKKA